MRYKVHSSGEFQYPTHLISKPRDKKLHSEGRLSSNSFVRNKLLSFIETCSEYVISHRMRDQCLFLNFCYSQDGKQGEGETTWRWKHNCSVCPNTTKYDTQAGRQGHSALEKCKDVLDQRPTTALFYPFRPVKGIKIISEETIFPITPYIKFLESSNILC